MKVLVTGNLGYIGQILTPLLADSGHEVTGLDAAYFPLVQKTDSNIVQITKDIRDVNISDLKGMDAIIHLAALSNDPTGELNERWTEEINYKATVNMAEIAKKAKVKKFLFSSSCSVYGVHNEILTESSSCNPLSAYAKSKMLAEKGLTKLNDENFSSIILRNGTAYGASPRMRLDLVVNNMVGHHMAFGHIKLLSSGTAWRPLVHVADISNAFITLMETDLNGTKENIYNVGCNLENYQTLEIAHKIKSALPGVEIEFSKDAQPDKRSYRVDFSKIADLGFKTQMDIKKGSKEIQKFLSSINFGKDDFDKSHFHNIRFLKELIENRNVDDDLRLKNMADISRG